VLSCCLSVQVNDEPANKSICEEGSANQLLYTKEGENGEANGIHKVVDVDVAKVEAPAVQETKETTAEILTTNAEEKKVNGKDLSKIKEVEPPQLEGLHALIQAVPNPQEEDVFMIPEAIVGPVVLPHNRFDLCLQST